MPVPVIVGAAAAIAARLAAKKLAPRVVGGIVGKGASKINPVYKEIGDSVKIIPAGSKPRTASTSQWQDVLNKMPSTFKKKSN